MSPASDANTDADFPDGESGAFVLETRILRNIDGCEEALVDSAAKAVALEETVNRLRGEISELETRLERAEAIDALTELYNRNEFLARLKQEKVRADRTQSPDLPAFSVVLFDIDRFSAYNEKQGQAAGDRLLKRFANFLKTGVRAYDVAARVGPDTFALILAGASIQQSLRVADTITARLAGYAASNPVDPRGYTCSVGVTDYRSMGRQAPREVDAIIARAEKALAQAKAAGGDGMTETACDA